MERLPTYAAVELFVVTVAFFMKFERICSAEALQTYFAAERFNQRLVPPSRL